MWSIGISADWVVFGLMLTAAIGLGEIKTCRSGHDNIAEDQHTVVDDRVQIPIAQWPRGLCREIATIKQIPLEQALSARLTFERGCDDLDHFWAAVFSDNGHTFALQRYDGIPSGDYSLVVMDDCRNDAERLSTFLLLSDLSGEAVSWRRSESSQ